LHLLDEIIILYTNSYKLQEILGAFVYTLKIIDFELKESRDFLFSFFKKI